MKHILIIAMIFSLVASRISAQNIISAKNAAAYIGHKITVCDKVYDSSHTTEGTLLFLGEQNSKPSLILIIKTSDLSKFKGQPEIDFKGKEICITGLVINDKGKPGIEVTDPIQIKPYLIDSPLIQNKSFH